MTRRAAILGLGSRGAGWATTCLAAGWEVRGFDPAPDGLVTAFWPAGCRRETTISGAVRRADVVICCLPERLELVQMVLQRAQAEAPMTSVIAVASQNLDIDALQNCAIRPGQVVRIGETDGDALALDVTDRNAPQLRSETRAAFAELAAVRSLALPPPPEDQGLDAESA
ncbi:MAG: NAD(P)-binding domain-containing protein [Silicimonas sp.]|jgi:carnitine 3-dehydrogenase|nr:NAD(P)-binding domain-containing protein [Silicimonas sp.]